MIALRKHYSGGSNTSRQIAAAERIRDTLHYKNERAMLFSSFLDKMQKMFNIFEEENEVTSEQAKVQMLLKKVEHPQLQDAVGALPARASMHGITFTECANHLSAQVSESADLQSTRKIAAATCDRTKEPKRIIGGGVNTTHASKRKGIYMPDGRYGPDTILTGHKCPARINKSSSTPERRTRANRPRKGDRCLRLVRNFRI